MTNKTRNLSTAEYFLQIQKEYLIAEFRRKIYHSPKDKAYYSKVMQFKAEKIESISKRNCLDSIFNSDVKYDEIRNSLFDKLGKPKFELSEKDFESYYSTGNEFSYRGDIFILDQINESGSIILYNKREEKFIEVKKEEICRIL